MFKSFCFKSINSLPKQPQGNSTESATSSGGRPASNFNLTGEQTLSRQSKSYQDIITITRSVFNSNQNPLLQDGRNEDHLVLQALHPDRRCVNEALSLANPSSLTRLASTFFDHSERASSLCLLLYRKIHDGHKLYQYIYELIEAFPSDTPTSTESQCNNAFDVFVKFDELDNPFRCIDPSMFSEMRGSFSQLEHQLYLRLCRSKSYVRLLNCTPSGFLCSAYTPCTPKQKEQATVKQLNAAARGTYVLRNSLDTISSLVSRLDDAIEGDRDFIRHGLERGRDNYFVPLMVEHIRKSISKNTFNFRDQLKYLEREIRCWFENVNVARYRVLQEIQ